MSSRAPSPGARSPRALWVLGCCFGLGVIAALAIGLVALFLAGSYRPYLEQRVRAAARERGLVIEFAELDASLASLELRRVKVGLVGVSGIEADLDRVVIRLERFEPVATTVHGGTVRAVGSAPVLALALAEWTRAYPATCALPLVADGLAVEWREAPGGEPWLVLTRGAVVPVPAGGAFAADAARIGGVEVGRIAAGYSATSARVELAFGAATAADCPVLITVQHAAVPPTATVTLRPTPLERLALPLGVPLPVHGVTASGEARLVLPAALGPGPVEGTLRVVLKGYVPPHPVELSGFVFGDTTEFETKLAVDADRQRVELTETRVTAGRFVVKGRGDVVRSAHSAQVRLALRGDLPCAALAAAAAESRLGVELGRIAGRLSREFIDGSVAVLLRIDADTKDLASTRVLRTIGVGCGLKPLTIPGLGTIDLSNLDLEDLPPLPPGLPSSFPAVPSGLPAVPSGWSLPTLPTGLPLPSLERARPAPGASAAPP